MPIKTSVSSNFDYQKALEKLYQTFAETLDDGFTYTSGDPKDKPMTIVKDGKELWKYIPCTYDSKFLAQIEKANRIKLPPPYKQYLLSCHHNIGHFIGVNTISDPANLRIASSYRLLVQLGYIPLGTDPEDREIFCLKRRKTSATGEYSVHVIESKYYYMALEMEDAMEYGRDDFYEHHYSDWEESPEDIVRYSLMKIAPSLSEFITYLSDKKNLEDYVY